MKSFIFAERNGVHIIDLQQTMNCIKAAFDATRRAVMANKSVLFVGTKRQAQQAIEREARNCDMFYVNNRWLGGTLTNFETIKKSLLQLKKLEKMEIDGTFELLPKKEVISIGKERSRLEKNLGGIKDMKSLPGIVFIIDTNKEAIAVSEAKRMKIPIVAVVDTNCDPTDIDYPIPGNDDAIRAISLFTQIISKAVIEADNEMGIGIIENLQDESIESTFETQLQDDQSIEIPSLDSPSLDTPSLDASAPSPDTPAPAATPPLPPDTPSLGEGAPSLDPPSLGEGAPPLDAPSLGEGAPPLDAPSLDALSLGADAPLETDSQKPSGE